MNPISGGWSGEYSIDGFTAKAAATTPISCLAKIQAQLTANKREVDVEDIRYQLEMQWYQRDPTRFARMPAKPSKAPPKTSGEAGLSNTKIMQAVFGFLNLSYRASMLPEDILPFLLEIFSSNGVGCPECIQIIRDIAVDPPKDWRYEIQVRLSRHYGVPVKPKPLIARSWGTD